MNWLSSLSKTRDLTFSHSIWFKFLVMKQNVYLHHQFRCLTFVLVFWISEEGVDFMVSCSTTKLRSFEEICIFCSMNVNFINKFLINVKRALINMELKTVMNLVRSLSIEVFKTQKLKDVLATTLSEYAVYIIADIRNTCTT